MPAAYYPPPTYLLPTTYDPLPITLLPTTDYLRLPTYYRLRLHTAVSIVHRTLNQTGGQSLFGRLVIAARVCVCVRVSIITRCMQHIVLLGRNRGQI